MADRDGEIWLGLDVGGSFAMWAGSVTDFLFVYDSLPPTSASCMMKTTRRMAAKLMLDHAMAYGRPLRVTMVKPVVEG